MLEVCFWLVCTLAYIGLVIVTVDSYFKNDLALRFVLSAALFFVTAAGIHISIEADKQHPCVKYEEQMVYNPAVKTMMPMKVCVERGEWVEDK